MKKLLIIMLFVVFAPFLNSPAKGENYVSKTFPPDEILLKALTIRAAPKKIIGKKRLSEDNYTVYYHDPDYDVVGFAEVVRLDNGIWVVVVRGLIHIIEK